MNKPTPFDSPLLDGSGNPVIDVYSSRRPPRPARKAKRTSKYLPHSGAKETARRFRPSAPVGVGGFAGEDKP